MQYTTRSHSFAALVFSGAWLLVIVITGCDSSGSAAPPAAEIDPDQIAARAMELYDADGNRSISPDECRATCPPLAIAFASFDADADGRLNELEIAARVSALTGTTTNMTSVDCTVTLDGRPLVGATVALQPAAMYGESLLPAQGVTDESGVARPGVSPDHLPQKLAGMSLLYPGLYRVEITHPEHNIPAQYNSASELGCGVDPLSRTGTATKFELKSK